MPNEARKASTFTACTAPAAADSLVVLTTSTVANNALATVNQLLANSLSNHVVANGYNLIIAGSNTPANSASLGSVQKGTIWADANNIYVATANGHVKSANIANFPDGEANLYWTMALIVNNAVLTSNGAQTVYWATPQPGTLVDILATAQGAVNDTGHIFISFGVDSGGTIAFLDPPLAVGETLTADTIASLGEIDTGTSVSLTTDGLGTAGADAEINLQLVFSRRLTANR